MKKTAIIGLVFCLVVVLSSVAQTEELNITLHIKDVKTVKISSIYINAKRLTNNSVIVYADILNLNEKKVHVEINIQTELQEFNQIINISANKSKQIKQRVLIQNCTTVTMSATDNKTIDTKTISLVYSNKTLQRFNDSRCADILKKEEQKRLKIENKELDDSELTTSEIYENNINGAGFQHNEGVNLQNNGLNDITGKSILDLKKAYKSPSAKTKDTAIYLLLFCFAGLSILLTLKNKSDKIEQKRNEREAIRWMDTRKSNYRDFGKTERARRGDSKGSSGKGKD